MIGHLVAAVLWAYGYVCPANRPGRTPKPKGHLYREAGPTGIVTLTGGLSADGRVSTIVGHDATGRVVYAATLGPSREARP